MKGQKTCKLFLFVSVFMSLCFLRPNFALASQPNPTNYWQYAYDESTPVDQPVVPQNEKPTVIGLLIAFGVAIMVIGYIFYQIIKMLNAVTPPPKPPPPPPTAPNTNYPPIVINPSGGPGPAPADFRAPTFDTNAPVTTLTNYDITSLKYLNTLENPSQPRLFDHFWSTGMMLSTNLVDWEDSHYRVDAYVSSGVGVAYMYYHYGTNFYNSYFTSDYIATNHIAPAYFDLSDRPYQDRQFFRLTPL